MPRRSARRGGCGESARRGEQEGSRPRIEAKSRTRGRRRETADAEKALAAAKREAADLRVHAESGGSRAHRPGAKTKAAQGPRACGACRHRASAAAELKAPARPRGACRGKRSGSAEGKLKAKLPKRCRWRGGSLQTQRRQARRAATRGAADAEKALSAANQKAADRESKQKAELEAAAAAPAAGREGARRS